MSQLRKRCTISRECGNWVELLDAASNQYIYYNKRTEENQWLPPLELSARFWCVCLGGPKRGGKERRGERMRAEWTDILEDPFTN